MVGGQGSLFSGFRGLGAASLVHGAVGSLSNGRQCCPAWEKSLPQRPPGPFPQPPHPRDPRSRQHRVTQPPGARAGVPGMAQMRVEYRLRSLTPRPALRSELAKTPQAAMKPKVAPKAQTPLLPSLFSVSIEHLTSFHTDDRSLLAPSVPFPVARPGFCRTTPGTASRLLPVPDDAWSASRQRPRASGDRSMGGRDRPGRSGIPRMSICRLCPALRGMPEGQPSWTNHQGHGQNRVPGGVGNCDTRKQARPASGSGPLPCTCGRRHGAGPAPGAGSRLPKGGLLGQPLASAKAHLKI